MKKFVLTALLTLPHLVGCGYASSYGDVKAPYSTNLASAPAPAAPMQQAQIPPTGGGDFTIAEAPPLAAVPNDPVAVAPIAETNGCELPAGLVGQNKTVLETMRFKGPIRVIGPNQPVTMDYRMDRLNIIHDQNGKITEVKCG